MIAVFILFILGSLSSHILSAPTANFHPLGCIDHEDRNCFIPAGFLCNAW